MKIANSYENCKSPHRNYTPKHENRKLIWKLQTDMKIANWYENCKAILTFWYLIPTSTFAIFIWDTAGMKTCSRTERMFPFDCGVDDENSTKQFLAKPSTIHIIIPIPMMTQSDSYFKTWFLCSLLDDPSFSVNMIHSTLAVRGLEELFFQLCCCVSFLVVAGNSFRCYLPTIPVVPLCLLFCCGGK